MTVSVANKIRYSTKTLTNEARDRMARYWARSKGCTCHLGHAPCGDCTDQDNPANWGDDEAMWREKTRRELLADRGILRDMALKGVEDV